ncbi:hypothetical protein N7281_00805 [Rickettsia hoogstraalii]|nr:hypothetical protein [Rickettsia hoogstraalii]
MLYGLVLTSLRGEMCSIDEAISGVLFHEIATLLAVARNDDLVFI